MCAWDGVQKSVNTYFKLALLALLMNPFICLSQLVSPEIFFLKHSLQVLSKLCLPPSLTMKWKSWFCSLADAGGQDVQLHTWGLCSGVRGGGVLHSPLPTRKSGHRLGGRRFEPVLSLGRLNYLTLGKPLCPSGLSFSPLHNDFGIHGFRLPSMHPVILRQFSWRDQTAVEVCKSSSCPWPGRTSWLQSSGEKSGLL